MRANPEKILLALLNVELVNTACEAHSRGAQVIRAYGDAGFNAHGRMRERRAQ
jgi:hypothetical protein